MKKLRYIGLAGLLAFGVGFSVLDLFALETGAEASQSTSYATTQPASRPSVADRSRRDCCKGKNKENCEGKDAMECRKGSHSRYFLMMDGVKKTVTNLANGVRIELTSDKPENVKKIQKHAKYMMDGHKKMADCSHSGEKGNCPWKK